MYWYIPTYIFTSLIITWEHNRYWTLLETINIETSSHSIPEQFLRLELSTAGGQGLPIEKVPS